MKNAESEVNWSADGPLLRVSVLKELSVHKCHQRLLVGLVVGDEYFAIRNSWLAGSTIFVAPRDLTVCVANISAPLISAISRRLYPRSRMQA